VQPKTPTRPLTPAPDDSAVPDDSLAQDGSPAPEGSVRLPEHFSTKQYAAPKWAYPGRDGSYLVTSLDCRAKNKVTRVKILETKDFTSSCGEKFVSVVIELRMMFGRVQRNVVAVQQSTLATTPDDVLPPLLYVQPRDIVHVGLGPTDLAVVMTLAALADHYMTAEVIKNFHPKSTSTSSRPSSPSFQSPRKRSSRVQVAGRLPGMALPIQTTRTTHMHISVIRVSFPCSPPFLAPRLDGIYCVTGAQRESNRAGEAGLPTYSFYYNRLIRVLGLLEQG
jgi:hypothetical protein